MPQSLSEYPGILKAEFYENFPDSESRNDKIRSRCVRVDVAVLARCDIKKTGKQGKSVPLQAWSGPDGSRKLRFPDFMTTAQGGGKVVSFTHRLHLPPGNSPGTHFC